MAAKLVIGFLSKRYELTTALFSTGGKAQAGRAFSTRQKTAEVAKEFLNLPSTPAPQPMNKILNFEEFKSSQVESFEQFKSSSVIQEKCGENIEKISRAYEWFCEAQYSLYKTQQLGQTPGRMI